MLARLPSIGFSFSLFESYGIKCFPVSRKLGVMLFFALNDTILSAGAYSTGFDLSLELAML